MTGSNKGDHDMTRTASSARMIALVASTALASLALGGCATSAAPRADLSASKAQQALQKGRGDQAVSHAEAAVLAEPRNPGYRAMLGAAYMEAGRFQSAATSFQDALTLGDTAPKTALSLALAQIAGGDNRSARSTLEQWQDSLDPADLGLAFALAGDARRGVDVLGSQLRSGNNSAKVRQNLAYSYALMGDWRAARLMAAEDVPANLLDARLSEWAAVSAPEDHHKRVAALLSVPLVGDSGQPAALALGNNPGTTGLAMEAARSAAPTEELPPVMAQAAPAPGYALPIVQAPARVTPAAPANFSTAFVDPAPATTAASYTTSPVVQAAAPTTTGTPRRNGRSVAAAQTADPAPVPAPAAGKIAATGGTHLIQLGSFSSEASAKRAWGIYAKRYPQLSAHDMVITQAVVRGKTYWRVSAAGFERASASAMCGTVKRSGESCIAWAEGRPLPGAVDSGVRMAAR